MYRLLKKGEKIQKGDLCFTYSKRWIKVALRLVGERCDGTLLVIRPLFPDANIENLEEVLETIVTAIEAEPNSSMLSVMCSDPKVAGATGFAIDIIRTPKKEPKLITTEEEFKEAWGKKCWFKDFRKTSWTKGILTAWDTAKEDRNFRSRDGGCWWDECTLENMGERPLRFVLDTDTE